MAQLKILYAIQGTGNGHVARAREVIPVLQQFGHVTVLLSGDQSQVKLPVQPTYFSSGLTFIYNKKGGISYTRTLFKNNILKIWKEIKSFPVEDFDVVINDFEFVTAWACRLRKKPCFALSHQCALWSSKVPYAKGVDPIGDFIIKNYAPAKHRVGFHFERYDDFIYPPVIRAEVRQLSPTLNNHYTVYLPAYDAAFAGSMLRNFDQTEWHIFTKSYSQITREGNLIYHPISSKGFLESLASGQGVLTSAGFETPAEARYLGKKVMVLPIKGQREQYYNAAAMAQLGIPVLRELSPKAFPEITDWLAQPIPERVPYRDELHEIVERHIFSVLPQESFRPAPAP